MRKWVIDVDVWHDIKPEQWTSMISNGLSGVIIRAAQADTFVDNLLAVHVGNAKYYNLPFGLYQWVDPTRPAKAQADYFLALINKHQPVFAAGDFEQYWTSWQEWYNKYTLGQNVDLSVISPAQIYNTSSAYITYLAGKLKIPFVAYTAAWYINGFCPQLMSLLNNYPYWNARYLNWNKSSMTFAEFQAFIADLQPSSPMLPHGCTHWEIWQISPHLPLPNLPALDIDLVKDDTTYIKVFGGLGSPPYIPPTPPAPVYKQYRVIATIGLRVRSTPVVASTNYLYTMQYGTVVTAYEVQNGWARIKPDQPEWCSMQWLQEITS